MNDQATQERAARLYSEMKALIEPLWFGHKTNDITAALCELMIDAALAGRTDKTRVDAMEMLAGTTAAGARRGRGVN